MRNPIVLGGTKNVASTGVFVLHHCPTSAQLLGGNLPGRLTWCVSCPLIRTWSSLLELSIRSARMVVKIMLPVAKFPTFLKFQHLARKPTSWTKMSPANTSQKMFQLNASAKNRQKAQITDSQITLPMMRLIQVKRVLLFGAEERCAKWKQIHQ